MNEEIIKEAEERGYLTLGDIRNLDLPDKTPIYTVGEPGCYLATNALIGYISQQEIDDNLELDPEDESSEDKPILALYFE